LLAQVAAEVAEAEAVRVGILHQIRLLVLGHLTQLLLVVVVLEEAPVPTVYKVVIPF
jgi:hypothetical protein